MSETSFGHHVSHRFGFALVLCDVLQEDSPEVTGAAVVLEEAALAKCRAELSDEGAAALAALEAFIARCAGCFGVPADPALLARVEELQQLLAIAGLTAAQGEDADYWSELLRGHVYTGHPDLPRIIEDAEAYLAGTP